MGRKEQDEYTQLTLEQTAIIKKSEENFKKFLIGILRDIQELLYPSQNRFLEKRIYQGQ